MYFPFFSRLQQEDLGPKPGDASLKLLYQVNLIGDYIKSAFQGNIALINTTAKIKKLTIKAGTLPTDNALLFQVALPTGYVPQGLTILQCYDLSGAPVGGVPWAEMYPGLQEGSQIKVTAIYGLTDTHTYAITFKVE